MKTVWKIPLSLASYQTVLAPFGADILCVQTQHNEPQLWVFCDPDAPKERRAFRIFGTGHDIAGDISGLTYIGTFQTDGGTQVGHLFEEGSA